MADPVAVPINRVWFDRIDLLAALLAGRSIAVNEVNEEQRQGKTWLIAIGAGPAGVQMPAEMAGTA